MTKWKSLGSKADYKAAVDRINELMDVKRTDAVHNELSLLSFLIEEYEAEYHSIPEASPLEVIRFAMEMKDIKQQDLIPILGTKGNVSKILSGKANIQLEDIQPLSEFLGIPMEALIPKADPQIESVGVVAEYVNEPEVVSGLFFKQGSVAMQTKIYNKKPRRQIHASKKKSYKKIKS